MAKAFRNIAGNVVEIDIDLDLNGHPILPPDTTVDPRPEPQPDHYVTVVGSAWVQIPIPVEYEAFETKKQKALNTIRAYREWYVNQPVVFDGVKFDADKDARTNLTQALTIYQATNYLPPAWINFDNGRYPLASIADLQDIVNAVQTSYSTRFFEMDDLRQQVLAATDETALQAIAIPTIPVGV